ncbi:MAG: hypothetical protein AAGE96_13895 [Cyanobacteria bacterium P01_G01_bin.19]
MISSELVFVQLAQLKSYVCIVELAMSLEASVSQVRHRLKELGDRVEHNDKDEWRVVKSVVSERILSEAEKAERDDLERTVQQAFFVAGQALKALRDKRLYRETHANFKSYVRDRFDFTRRAADYLISAAEIVENLKAANSPTFQENNESELKREQIVLKTNVLPTKESQCRFLAKLSPEEQRQAWGRAVELAGNKVPSSRLVKEAVRQIKSVDSSTKTSETSQPSFREVNYTAGIGVEYTVRFDEETYYRLQAYQDKIGSATKSGAVARLLDAIAEQE